MSKYYYKHSCGKYMVCKKIKENYKYAGLFETEEIAKKVVDYLNKHNWDDLEINKLKLGVKLK